MTREPFVQAARFPFGVLTRFRGVQLRNALDQHLREAPLRAFAVLVLLVIIWAALYLLLSEVLRQIGRWELVALVAKKYIFIHFFLVLAIMLAFSNAVLAFGSLFGREEAPHLLAMPVSPRQVVCLKWLEGMLLSSWSFLLLGVPLMLAVARNTEVAWYYYPLFAGHFLGFVVIPATLGVVAAWAVALWFPRRPATVMTFAGGALAVIAIGWLWRISRHRPMSSDWLDALYGQLNLARLPFLPSTWTARGILAAMEERVEYSLFYLAVVLANGAFIAWLAINLVGNSWALAYSRARQGRGRTLIRNGYFTETLCGMFFFYLPERIQQIMLKDLRSFARDPGQWMQMVIMLGLLVLYAINLKRLPVDLGHPGTGVLLAFLNLTVVSLILATFTSRFVFPLLSLETQQLWLLGLLPVRRRTLLLVKFAFSLTITAFAGLLVVGLSVRALALPAGWVWLQMAVCLGICIGLSGLAVGTGARFPMVGQRNPARIASGFGGTFNLIASMLFVAAEMAGLVYAGLVKMGGEPVTMADLEVAYWMVPVLLLFGIAVATLSLWVGARHFDELDY